MSDLTKIVKLSDIKKHPRDSLAADDYVWTDERIERVLAKPDPREIVRLKYAIKTGYVRRQRVIQIYLRISITRQMVMLSKLRKVFLVLREVI